MIDIINKALEKLGYYRIENLRSTGMCGLCGKQVIQVLPKYDDITVCEDCAVCDQRWEG